MHVFYGVPVGSPMYGFPVVLKLETTAMGDSCAKVVVETVLLLG